MANDLIEIGINVRSNADEATRGLTRLESEIVKQVREVNRLERGYKDLDRAMNSGKITAQTYARGVQQLDSAIEAVWDSSKRASVGVDTFSQSIERSTVATKRMQGAAVGNVRSQNALGVATQQAGYQIGDFLVQVQSGTNAMVAFGQQATQLVGVLPLFSPRLIGISAALGIMIPLLTAVGAAMQRTGEQTTKTVFDFRRFFTDVKASLEPLMPIFTAIGNAASAVGQAFVKMANLAVNNLDSILIAAAAVSALFVAQMIPAIVSATKAIVVMTAAALKNPLFLLATAAATLAVGFYKLVEATGSWGNAVSLLGEVASGVWSGIVTSAKAIPTGLQAVWATVAAGFYKMVGNLQRSWLKFLNSLSRGFADMGATGPSSMIAGFAENVGKGLDDSIAKADEFSAKASKLTEEAKNLATEGFTEAQVAMGKLSDAMSTGGDKVQDLSSYFKEVEDSSKGAGKAGSKAGKDIEKAFKTAQEVFDDAIVTAEEFEQQLAEGVVSAVDSVANAWGDFVMRGFQDFKGFVASVWSSFKSLISNMIATAAKNKILISLGLGGGATAGTMAGAAQSVAGASSGLLGGSGFLGLGGGAGSVFGGAGLLGAGGGSGMLGLGAGSGLATTFGGGALGTIASYALPIAGVAMLVAGFFKKTKEIVANGVRIQLDGVEAELASYEKSKTTNGFGVSSGFSRDFTRLDDAVQDAVSARIGATVQNLGALGLGTNLTGFAFSKRTEVKEGETFEGESEEVIRAALDAAVEFATQGALDGFTRTGETLSETLDRLVISLQAANPTLQLLGGSAFDISVNGADAASKLIELSGGLEAFAAKSDYLFQNFLTLEEQQTRLADAAKVVISDFEQFYNVALPETHAEFMALVNAQDLNTEAGRQLRAALQDVADEFITVKGTAEEAVGALRDLGADTASFESAIRQQQSLISRAVDALVKPLQEALDRTKTQAERSFRIFSEAADKTRDEAQSIVDILTDVISSRVIQSEAVERMRYQQAQQQLEAFAGGADFTPDQLRRATEGVDIDTTKFFGSFEDYARDFYKTQISLTKLADKAEGELTDVEKQIDIAEKAYEVALGTYQESQDFNTALNQLLTDLAVYTETAARNEPFIEQIKAEGDRQVDLLDQILVETKKQVNEFLGLETSLADLVGTNVSVGEALEILGKEGSDLSGAVMALEPVVDTIGSHIAELDLTLGGAVDRLGLNLADLVNLDLTAGFENLDLFKPLADMDFGEKFKPITDFFSQLDLTGAFSEVNLAKAFSEVNLAEAFSEINLAEGFSEINLAEGFSEINLAEGFSELDLTGSLSGLDLSGAFSELDLTGSLSGLDLSGAFSELDLAEGFSEINLAEAFQSLDLSGPLSEQVQKLSDMDIVGDLQEPLGGLQSEISFLDETASGLNLGVVGLDGSVALLSSSVGTHSENLLTLNGTIVNDLGGKLGTLGTNTGDLNVVVGNLSSATGDLSLSVTNFGQTFSSAASTLTGMVSSLSSSVSSLAGAQRAQAAAQQAAAQAAAAQAAADAARSEQIRSPLVDTAVETYVGSVPNQTEAARSVTSEYVNTAINAFTRGTTGFATGGMHIGGMRLVGEQGPELEVTGPSRIYSAQQTKNMLSGGSSEAASEIRMLRREVSELRAEQRKIGVENVKYNKKSYDLNREWDIVGLPATRT